LTGSADLVSEKTPQFMHAYIHKTFGTIPSLFLAAPMPSGNRYSQLCITYMVGFVLGMLARYFPTHWVSLAQGNKGDALWPTLNRAHRFVEESFPELAAEMIEDILAHPS
jgi:YaaC-like Protein